MARGGQCHCRSTAGSRPAGRATFPILRTPGHRHPLGAGQAAAPANGESFRLLRTNACRWRLSGASAGEKAVGSRRDTRLETDVEARMTGRIARTVLGTMAFAVCVLWWSADRVTGQ